jgi:hypothetical protein
MRNLRKLSGLVRRPFVSLFIMPLCIMAGLAAAHGQITPSQDAYIDTASPGINFGSATALGVVSPSQTAFIQFDLSPIPSGYTSTNIAKATLKLYVSSVATAGSFNVDFVNGSWSEKTLTSNNAPALGTTIAGSVPLIKGNVHDYLLIDLTSALGAWLDGTQSNDGIALVANSPLSATVESKENARESQPAELDIVFASGGITGVLTGAGSGLKGGGTSGKLNLSLLTSCASGQVLSWNGSAWVCTTVRGTGSVTSVGLSAPASDFTVSGSPVTSSGTLGLNWTTAPTSGNVANAIVKRDSTGSFSTYSLTAQGQIFVNNTSLLNPLVSLASATNAAAIIGQATGSGITNGVLGTSVSTIPGSAGVQGTDNNTGGGNYTAGVSGRTVNPLGLGVLGTGKTLSNVGKLYLGRGAAGVWADNSNFGLVATSDLNAVVAYNNHASAATIFAENDTTSGSSFLMSANAPNVQSNGNPASCFITTHADLGCTGDLKADGTLRVGQDATQPSTANGLVKAMFYFDPSQPAGSQIVTCFNSQLTGAAASTPPCGITVSHLGLGYNGFDFGFTVQGRIIQATAQMSGPNLTGVSISAVFSSEVDTYTYYAQGSNVTDTPIYVTVF